MSLRAEITDALKEAMRSKDKVRLSTLRLINAAIKDKDIEARGNGSTEGIGEPDVLALLGKMVKQRQESARIYEEGGRLELAEQENQEISTIEEFLPKQLSEGEVEDAIAAAIESVGAETIRDMGEVMAELKAKYTGQIDFGKAGALVKGRLS